MNKRNNRITSYFILFSLMLVLGVVYAILQANLQINGTAKIAENRWNVHFDNIIVNSNSVSIGTGDSAATIDPNDNCKVDFEVTLSLPGDFYEFTVDVINEGSIDAMVGGLEKTLKVNNVVVETIPDYLIYTVTYEDGDEILENHLLAVGETETYKVILKYNEDIEELPTGAQTISTSVEPVYIQADNGAVNRPVTMLINGKSFNARIKQLSGTRDATYNSSNTNITSIQKSSTAPDINLMTNDNIVSVSEEKPIYVWFDNGTIYYYSDSNKIFLSPDSSYMFYNLSSLTSLDLSNLDTSRVTDMSSVFNGCTGLTSLDLTSFDTSNVTNMSFMFIGCSHLTSLNVSSFNTSNVTRMTYMFNGCSGLTSLNLSNFDTSNVTDISYMFEGCSGLTILNVSNFNTSKVTNMFAMFASCSGLTSLDLSNFNTSNVSNMRSMFEGCSSLTELNLSGFDFRKNSNTFSSIAGSIFGHTSSLKKINMSNWKLPSNMSDAIFRDGGLGSSPIEEIDVTGWDLSQTTNLSRVLAANGSNGTGGTGIRTIKGLNTWDTSHITNMYGMFNGLSSLTSLDLSSFNTSNVTNMGIMFIDCSSLTALDLSSFDIGSSVNLDGTFYGCSSLTTAYAKTQADVDRLNASAGKPTTFTFVVKP